MAKVIKFYETGAPEVMKLEEVDLPKPGEGEVRVRHTAIGVNVIDTYFRSGLYPQPLPGFLGSEGAGIVEEVGPNVQHLKVGDRVAYGTSPLGSYSTERNMAERLLVNIPDGIDDITAASIMLKGMTAQYLLRQVYQIKKDELFLWHAAAGGVGLIASQWARVFGARMIGTEGSAEKCAQAKAAGCEFLIDVSKEDFVERVKEITEGKMVDVVYDSVGKATFPASLDCLRPRGLWVTWGNTTGAVPPFEVTMLMRKGSLYCTRPNLAGYARDRELMTAMAQDVFSHILDGSIKGEPGQTFPLADAAKVHTMLQAHQMTGATVLIP